MTGVKLLPDNSSLQQDLIHIIWTNAESPVSQINIILSLQFKNLAYFVCRIINNIVYSGLTIST